MTDNFEAKYKQQADRAHDLANQCQVLMNEKYLLEISNKELFEACDAAETMLRVMADTTTSASGTKPMMKTAQALQLVRAAITKARGQP